MDTVPTHVIGASDARPWFKAELHGHHTFREPLDTQVAKYRTSGYNFVVYCSKDNDEPIRAGGKYDADGFLVIDGVEQAFRLANRKYGHVIGFPFAAPYPSPTTDEWTMKEGYAKLRDKTAEAILGVAHPHDKRWSIDDIMEAWDRDVFLFELNSIDMKHGEFETELWDQALNLGAKFPAILSNDVHKFADIDDYGYIMIQADELTQEAIFDAMRNAAFYAVESGCQARPRRYELLEIGNQKVLEVEAPGAVQIRIVGDGDAVRKVFNGERAHHPVTTAKKYIRAELVDGNGLYVFLQPFFL